MPNPLIELPDARNLEVLGQKVWAKTEWDADWEEKLFVHATKVTWSASPSIGEATLYYRYGRGRQTSDGEVLDYEPFTLPNLAYVQIELTVRDLSENADPPTKKIYWYGVAGRLVNRRKGSDILDGETNVPQGVQEIYCSAIEWLLDREFVTFSVARANNSGTTTQRLNTGITFNKDGMKNRSAVTNIPDPSDPDEVHTTSVFAHHREDAEYWSTRQIVKYLLAYHSPRDVTDQQPMQWRLNDTTALLLSDTDYPTVVTEGQSILDILNRLIPRQRGYGFYFKGSSDGEFAGNTNRIELVVFTLTPVEVSLPGGGTIPANENKIDLKLSASKTNDLMTITDAFTRFHRVRVRGNKINYCFSVRPTYNYAGIQQLLNPYWDEADATLYTQGADNPATLPPEKEITERRQAIAAFRSNPKFEDVFSKFRILPTFVNELRDFNQTARKIFVDPDNLTTSVPFDLRVCQFLPRLPLVRGLDYSSAPTVPDFVADDEYLEPFVVLELPNNNTTKFPADRYIIGSEVSRLNEHERYSQSTSNSSADSYDYNIAFKLKPVEAEQAAIKLEASHGDVRFNGWMNSVAGGSGTDVCFTVAMEGADYCEAVVEYDPFTTVDYIREKIIYQDPKLYRLDVMIAGTVWGIGDNMTPQVNANAQIIRDDREDLEAIGEMALTWYGLDRQAMSLETTHVNSNISLGVMIENVIEPNETVAINTVVTNIEFSYSVSSGTRGGTSRMSFQTNSAELDSYF